jgi:type II secretory pathway pseudopilin PulG
VIYLAQLTSFMSVQTNKKGFSLVEAIVAIGILMIFASGVYGGIQLVFKVVYQSRLRTIESSILNEQLEIVRNMSFFDVGIINGSPTGLLARTVTTTKNGIDFTITRTIRNIDDEFDGTIGGSPNDTAPADYKLVDISVVCDTCGQADPISVSSYVGPKFLENSPDNGALFVEVLNANGQPVPGATVGISATSTSSTYDFEDTTANDGVLRIVDLESGIGAYAITVTKDGYTMDMTTTTVTNPTKPQASVVAQSVTSRTFSIDLPAQIEVETLDASCSPVGNVDGHIQGTSITGTNPDTYRTDSDFTTDGNGQITFADALWDTYDFVITGYDLIGAIPIVPLSVLPGSTVPVTLIVGASSGNSVLVQVEDNTTGDPISNASVMLSKIGFESTKTSGIGTTRQQDWSGGAGQTTFTDVTRYAADDGNITVSSTDLTLADLGGTFVLQGWLESSTVDTGTDANYVSLDWDPIAQPAQTGTSSIRMRFATGSSPTTTVWNYLGPDGTSSTYYTNTSQQIAEVHDGDQYARYKLFLSTDSSTSTPVVSDIAFTYVAACTPPGQVYFGGVSADTYDVTVSTTGYAEVISQIEVSGVTSLVVPLTAE